MRETRTPDEDGREGFDPDKDLQALFTEAYTRYREEVIGDGKSYDRYAGDFISDHRFNDAATLWEGNRKYTNTVRIDTLLMERRDLVEKYFSSDVFLPSDFTAMFGEFNRGAAPASHAIAGTKRPNFGCGFTTAQTQAIAAIANDFNIFKRKVTGKDISVLFSPSPGIRLISANNRKLAILFDALARERLITGEWQKVIAATGAIVSSANAPLTQSKLSTALSDARSEKTAWFSTIRKRVHEIAETE